MQTKREELLESHRKQIAELEAQEAFTAHLPKIERPGVDVSMAHFTNPESREPWIVYKAHSLADVIAIFEAFERVPFDDVYTVEGYRTIGAPENQRREIKNANKSGMTGAVLVLGRGKEYSTKCFEFWARLAGRVVRVKIDEHFRKSEWGYSLGIAGHANYDRHGNVTDAHFYIAQPLASEIDSYAKFGTGSRDAADYRLMWHTWEKFKAWAETRYAAIEQSKREARARRVAEFESSGKRAEAAAKAAMLRDVLARLPEFRTESVTIQRVRDIGYSALNKSLKEHEPEALKIGLHDVVNALYFICNDDADDHAQEWRDAMREEFAQLLRGNQ